MFSRLTLLAVLLLSFSVPISVQSQELTGVAWAGDVERAKQIASEQNKYILVVFTGRGWCQPCELLNQLLFQDEEFVRSVGGDFVLVELDFNFGSGRDEQAREARYRAWKKEYLVHGYPTMIFADDDGRPFLVESYYHGDTADNYLHRIRDAISQCEQRDVHFAASREHRR